jgi:5-methylcytosine-specific restriction protein A
MTFRARRLEFTAETKRSAFARSGGICECHLIPWLKRPDGCGVRLVAGAIFYEHVIQDAIRPDNSLDNCAVLTRTCWKEKTARIDLPVIAKSNRVRNRHIGAVATPQQVIVGSRASGWKNHMRGGWSRR